MDDSTLLKAADRLEVTLTSGAKVLVPVKVLSVRGILSYADLERNPAALAELFTGEKAGWADSLTIESVFSVVEAGIRLNEPNFLAFRVGGEKVGAAAQSLVTHAAASGAGSPKSAS